MKEAKELLNIIKCYLNNEKYIINTEINESALYKLAKKHNLSNFLYNWSINNCNSEEIKEKIKSDYNMQIAKDTNQTFELDNLLNKFEKNNIKVVLLKGVILKNIYPENYMRQMGDIDIYVDENNFEKASQIMINLDYKEFFDYEKHLVFKKEPFVYVEMHKKLVTDRDVGHEYLNNIWPLCVKYKDYQNIYELSLEDAYFFAIVHLIIHFKFTGISIKDVLDIYLYNEKYKNKLDYNKIDKTLKEFNILEFENNIKNIAYKWFYEKNGNDFNDIENFILNGYNIENQVNYSIGKIGTKTKYLINLFFPKYKIMEEKYPILQKFPILLPITWIHRIFKDIFSEATTLDSRVKTIKLIKDTNPTNVEYIQNIYKKLGIDK